MRRFRRVAAGDFSPVFKAGVGHKADFLFVAYATVESSPDVPLIILDAVFLQQLAVLLLKALVAMMLTLILNVLDDLGNV